MQNGKYCKDEYFSQKLDNTEKKSFQLTRGLKASGFCIKQFTKAD